MKQETYFQSEALNLDQQVGFKCQKMKDQDLEAMSMMDERFSQARAMDLEAKLIEDPTS